MRNQLRNKVITFVTQLKKCKMKGNEKGELTVVMHDLFGSILVLSLQKKKVDMAEVLR